MWTESSVGKKGKYKWVRSTDFRKRQEDFPEHLFSKYPVPIAEFTFRLNRILYQVEGLYGLYFMFANKTCNVTQLNCSR